jgi:hypothetical protein
MHESDLHAEQTAVRDVVDHVYALPREVCETAREVVDFIRDVVHPRAALREELADRRLLAQRAKELDAARTEPNRNRLDALRLERVAPLYFGAEQPLIRVHRLLEVLDRDA